VIKTQADAPGLDDARSTYVAETSRSADLARSATGLVAQEVIRTLDLPHSIYIASAHGPFMEDVDGNRYIDIAMGFGSHVLGHRPDAVSRAVREQLDRGWQFGLPDAQQQDVAALVRDAAPAAERVVFVNSGTEATMYAMRVARAFTRKARVAVFDGNYRGMHDYA
jgi:glutamate-1-semialdehyde 2,1-aminomutase